MSADYQTKVALSRPFDVAASQTLKPVCSFPSSSAGRLNSVIEILLGKTVGTPTIALQESMGKGSPWVTVKTAAAVASTNLTVSSVSMSTGELTTSAPHGLTDGTPVVLSSTDAPGGLQNGFLYYTVSTGASTLRLAPTSDLAAPIQKLATAGVGPYSLSVVQAVTIRVSESQDATKVPLKPILRIAVTTAAGQTTTVVSTLFGVPY